MGTLRLLMAALDLDLVRHALAVARKHGFAEVELAVGEDRFSARLAAIPKAPATGPSTTASEVDNVKSVVSTLVGYYRPARTPLAVGQMIKPGDVVAVVAALGIANDVETKVGGEVIEILVEDGQPVEFGQPLAKVRVA